MHWHHSTFVCHQFFGFFQGSVHILQILSDDVHPVLPWSSRLSLVASQFPLYCLMGYCEVLHSQYSCRSHLRLASLTMCFNFRNLVFFLMSSFLTLSFHVIVNSLRWNLWWAVFSFFICVTGSGHSSAPYSSLEITGDSHNSTFTDRLMWSTVGWIAAKSALRCACILLQASVARKSTATFSGHFNLSCYLHFSLKMLGV